MNAEELGSQLQNKRRTVADLARFISTRTDENPNHTVLLGAGASITSKVRSASELTRIWRDELCPNIVGVEAQRQYLKQHHGDWFDPSREYSSLFEKKYDLQRQRRMFVEQEVAGKTPSLGYAYLTALVNQAYFNTIFTTNFDDLINEAFYLYSDQRPIVCAHDSSVNSITVTSKRPKVIKLHGDYLFDDIKSTARETESLEQNTKAKFAEFARDFGMIVVGYSGCDRSVMEAISTLLKSEDYFKGGIYWCMRKDSEVSEELKKLLWREKTYFVIVDGFDELFAELYSKFNKGKVLPISTLSISRRPSEIVGRLTHDGNTFPTDSPILQKAYEQLKRQSKRTMLMDLIVNNDDVESANKDLSDDELITQFEIQKLIDLENFRDAIAKGRQALNLNLGDDAKRNIFTLMISACRQSDDLPAAIKLADDLISWEPHNASHYLLKSNLWADENRTLEEIEKAINVNPYFVRAYYFKAKWCIREASRCHGEQKIKVVADAEKALVVAADLDPSVSNPCWELCFKLTNYEKDKISRRKTQAKIIDGLSKMDPNSITVLSIRTSQLNIDSTADEIQRLVSDIERVQLQSRSHVRRTLECFRLEALSKSKDLNSIRDALAIAEATQDVIHNSGLAQVVADIKRKRLGLDQEAIVLLDRCLKSDFDPQIGLDLLDALIDLGKIEDAESILNKYSTRLPLLRRNLTKVEILDGKKDFDAALKELARHRAETGDRQDVMQMYLLNRKGAFEEAERYGRELLQAINFSKEAAVEIINFEIACKHVKGKPNVNRLEEVLSFTDSEGTKAGIYALLNRRREMLQCIRTAVEIDKTFRYQLLRWPVFEDFRNDVEFLAIQELGATHSPILTAVPDSNVRSAA